MSPGTTDSRLLCKILQVQRRESSDLALRKGVICVLRISMGIVKIFKRSVDVDCCIASSCVRLEELPRIRMYSWKGNGAEFSIFDGRKASSIYVQILTYLFQGQLGRKIARSLLRLVLVGSDGTAELKLSHAFVQATPIATHEAQNHLH